MATHPLPVSNRPVTMRRLSLILAAATGVIWPLTGRRGSDPHGSVLWNGSTRGELTRFSQNLSVKCNDPCEILHQTGLS